jgi:MFS transporter, AAHS family, 4-hydroxybenzoate transporter
MAQLESGVLDVSSFIDSSRVSRFQVRVLALCAAVALLDGFDTQSIAFVAPAIASDWSLSVGQFGPIFAAGLVGLTFGALVLGSSADRIGRRRAIIISTAWFGAMSLATLLATSFNQLLLVRFLTGLGLGGAMPNIIALSAEYSPKRLRATLVTLMFCGFPFGAVVGGILSAKLITTVGWHSVFVVGGIFPLLLAVLQVLALPESISYLVAHRSAQSGVAAIVRRIDPGADRSEITGYILPEEQLPGVPIRHLFAEHRTVSTIALWVMFFCNLLMLFFLFNWLPTVLTRMGIPLGKAIIGTVALNAGGIIGALCLSRLIDRTGPYIVLFVSNCLAALFIVSLGYANLPLAALIALIFMTGCFVIGTQFCIMSHTANFYPTTVRATGLGWALGVGRIGSILGPLIGGILVAASWSTGALFEATATPAVISAVAIMVLRFRAKRVIAVAPSPVPIVAS